MLTFLPMHAFIVMFQTYEQGRLVQDKWNSTNKCAQILISLHLMNMWLTE